MKVGLTDGIIGERDGRLLATNSGRDYPEPAQQKKRD
jgi:hypothetical protein